jgi:UDP-glucose:glycoprotein glucosyltransferase
MKRQLQDLQFDRIYGNMTAPHAILYVDISSPEFGVFHKSLSRTAQEGKISYRIRHTRSTSSSLPEPLLISGYGVELALKRTDYIVIDDREEDGNPTKEKAAKNVNLEDEELADLKPLSTSELLSLGLKASSFVMQSEDPFETLVKLSQDFPKFSSAIAAYNISDEFLTEHENNRAQLVPAGMNVIWINGLQIIERLVDAFTLLDHLRGEKKLIDSVKNIGLTGPEAISLLASPEVSSVKTGDEPQRYDWRDIEEGGNVIIWLNDIEKDNRYEGWPDQLNAVGAVFQSPNLMLITPTASSANVPRPASGCTPGHL